MTERGRPLDEQGLELKLGQKVRVSDFHWDDAGCDEIGWDDTMEKAIGTLSVITDISFRETPGVSVELTWRIKLQAYKGYVWAPRWLRGVNGLACLANRYRSESNAGVS